MVYIALENLLRTLIMVIGLSGELTHLQLLNDGGIGCVIRMDDRPIPLILIDDIRTATQGTVALGKSLVNRPLAMTLLDHTLPRTFGFVENSLDHSLVGALGDRRWKGNVVVDSTPRQDW